MYRLDILWLIVMIPYLILPDLLQQKKWIPYIKQLVEGIYKLCMRRSCRFFCWYTIPTVCQVLILQLVRTIWNLPSYIINHATFTNNFCPTFNHARNWMLRRKTLFCTQTNYKFHGSTGLMNSMQSFYCSCMHAGSQDIKQYLAQQAVRRFVLNIIRLICSWFWHGLPATGDWE